jgi:uncharacterized protein (DUF2147 family)
MIKLATICLIIAQSIIGKWTNADHSKEMNIVQTATGFSGTVDGKEILQQLVQNKNGTYSGKVYLPKKNQTFPCTLALKGNDTLSITVKVGFFSQTKTWTRIK